ncbi:MAG: hypothetical protein ACI9M6_001208 [Hydrogenophaga sp.]|jgi:hypothetical protein
MPDTMVATRPLSTMDNTAGMLVLTTVESK